MCACGGEMEGQRDSTVAPSLVTSNSLTSRDGVEVASR